MSLFTNLSGYPATYGHEIRYRETLQAADYLFKTHYGVPLAMVGIDPLIDAYGAEKENSSEEANAAKGAFRKLVKEFLFLRSTTSSERPATLRRSPVGRPTSCLPQASGS